MTPVRYGIYLANLDPTLGREIAKTRPGVLLTPSATKAYAATVVGSPSHTSPHPSWR